MIRTGMFYVFPKGADIFSERAFKVELQDEGAGQFVEVTCQMEGYGAITIEDSEWPDLKKAIDQMFDQIKKYEQETEK